MVQKILVLNSKGGCGKTTIATNLASYYAFEGYKTALLDYDPQASSMRWLSQRSENLPAIFGVEAHKRATNGMTTSWALRVPPETQRIIFDAPAGVSGHHVLDYVQQVDSIIIPVLPSHIDIHAATRFIEDLLLIGKVRQLGVRVGVVANRVKKNTTVYHSLERFLNTLRLPLITELRDTQHYVRAAGQGIGVCDMWDHRARVDQEHWQPLYDWLENSAAETRIVKQAG